MGKQRGAGRLYFNPHWRDTPQGTEVSFWLATDRGPVQATLSPQESVAFIPTNQTSHAASLLQMEKDYRLTPLQLRDFHRQPVSGLYWPHPSPAYAVRKAAARKWCHRL
ncbi:DNA polymerase II [Salmonella bongori]|nr:DNA polymerase II [Salmonella bongori]